MLNIKSTRCGVLCGCLLVGVSSGCSSGTDTDSAIARVNETNIERLANLYFTFQSEHDWRGPANEADFKSFLSKYMSWASMKDDMVKIYVGEFTEPELKELAAFYQTPLGRKTVQKMPALLAKGAEMGQKRVQEHLPELQAAIQSQAGAAKKAP